MWLLLDSFLDKAIIGFFNIVEIFYIKVKPGDLCLVRRSIRFYKQERMFVWDNREVKPGKTILILSITRTKDLDYIVSVLYEGRTCELRIENWDFLTSFIKLS